MNMEKEVKNRKRIENNYISELLGYPCPVSWINFPRYLNDLFDKGHINSTDYLIYAYMRNRANVSGVSYISTDELTKRLFPDNKLKIDTVNKSLRKLFSLKLVHYSIGKGRRGVFDIWFGDVVSIDGSYTNIQLRFESSTSNRRTTLLKSYVNTLPDETNRTSPALFVPSSIGKINHLDTSGILPSNTDIKTNTNKFTGIYKGKHLVTGFNPKSKEEFIAHNIANKVADMYMDPYLKIIKDRELWLIEKAYGQLKEELQVKEIKDKPKYLFGIVNRMRLQKKENTI